MEYTIYQARTQLSRLLAEAKKGEIVVITEGRERKPIARIIPIASCRIGFLEGVMPDIGPGILRTSSGRRTGSMGRQA